MLPHFAPYVVGLLLALGAAAAPAQSNNTYNGMRACSRLKSVFSDQTYLPDTAAYTNESSYIWSQTCLLSPFCVFLPINARQLARGIDIIRRTQSPFSVRSGGHMPVVGAQSTDDGVFISLSGLNGKEMHRGNTVARFGAGLTWLEVYIWASTYGVGLPGGRYGQVGVGGLLTGGGINYFGNRVGWSMNNIIGYELVIGDGSILDVSADSHPDLFWALKGGNNNFGVITRFDMKTFPITSAYTGGNVWFSGAIPAFTSALEAFVTPGGGIDDLDTAINPSYQCTPATGAMTVSNIPFVQGNSTNPTSVANFTAITTDIEFSNVGFRTPWFSTAAQLATPAFTTRTQRQMFRSVSLKADPKAIQLCFDVAIPPAIAQLANVNGSSASVAIQPISRAWVQAAKDAGGDTIALDPADGPLLVVLISVTWNNEADDGQVLAFSEAAVANLTEQAQRMGLYYPFIYVNDAALGQNPYPLYGKGSSLPRMKAIQRRYDSDGVFRNLISSGFKLFA